MLMTADQWERRIQSTKWRKGYRLLIVQLWFNDTSLLIKTELLLAGILYSRIKKKGINF